MTATESFALEVHEMTELCLAHNHKVFKGWTREMIFLYVAWHFFHNTAMVHYENKKIVAIAFCWPEKLSVLLQRFSLDESIFYWYNQNEPDCLFIAEVIGSSDICCSWAESARARWPQLTKWFTFRSKPEPKLVELHPNTLWRFCGK